MLGEPCPFPLLPPPPSPLPTPRLPSPWQKDIKSNVMSLEDFDPENLPDQKQAVFIMACYGVWAGPKTC
jgi:hypothetical protein